MRQNHPNATISLKPIHRKLLFKNLMCQINKYFHKEKRKDKRRKRKRKGKKKENEREHGGQEITYLLR